MPRPLSDAEPTAASARIAHRRPRGVVASVLLASIAGAAGAALVVRAVARRAERRHPPQGSFLDIEGVRLHYVERGKGSPVVLLHGNGAMIEDYEISGVLDQVAERHRVIAIDRPGFGYSDRPRRRIWTPLAQANLLHRALKELGVERPIVVGHSWGTLVALALALEHPADVGGLVLLSGYYFRTARADVPILAPPAVPVLGDVMRYTISPLLGKLFARKIIGRVFAPSAVPARFKAEFPIGLALRPWQIRAGAADTALMIPAAAGLSRRYGELTMPVAIMAGSDDRIVDVGRHSKRLHREIPGSELRVIPGAGHMIHHLAPEAVLDLIQRVEARADSHAPPRRAAAE